MHVLMITGDKKMVAGYPRFDLQAGVVETLTPLYMGFGSVWPTLPKDHFDVVTTQDPFLRGAFGYIAARRIHARLNVQVHTDLSAQPLWRRLLARIVLSRADSVRVVSEKIKQQVEHMGVTVPVHVLPIYIDVKRFKNLVPQPHGQKTLLWMGRFEDEKDPLLALEVFKTVHTQVDAKFVMLGVGSLDQTLRRAAGNLPVTFPGWQDPVDYLVQADVVLSTSKHESYGASIIEALAASVPVVAPDIGIAKEAGAVVVPRDELAKKVIELLQAPVRGALTIPMLSVEEWSGRWKETL